jgi:hypothetical protein
LLFSQTGNASTSARDNSCAVIAIPGAGTYSLTVGFELIMSSLPFTYGGICLTDGVGATPKLLGIVIQQRQVAVSEPESILSLVYDTNPTTTSSEPLRNVAPAGYARQIFLRITDDRTTNLTFSYSFDNRIWLPYGTALGRTAFLTPAYAGLYLGQLGTSTAVTGGAVAISKTRSAMKVFHWSLG